MTTTSPIKRFDGLYIGGEWVAPGNGTDPILVLDSTTEEPFLSVASASPDDVTRAVTAARQAFDHTDWSRSTPETRAHFLRGIAAGMLERADEIADIWVRQSGMLHRNAIAGVRQGSAVYSYFADLAESFSFHELRNTDAGGFGLIVREAVGVVGAIVPWNGPTRLTAVKVGPALAAGCTVVLKASREAPGESYILAEIADSIGLPPGILNVFTTAPGASETLVRDPRVDKISFTGSTEVGRRIAAIMAERIGRVTLELGGKSPAIVLDDYDLDKASELIATQELYNGGQVCSSLTRVLVSKKRAADLADALARRFADVRVGDPFEESSDMGPLASAEQVTKVKRFIGLGVEEGAELVVGGADAPEGRTRGYYVKPTLFTNVDNSSELAQNEIFGPVLAVIPVEDEDAAVHTANDTIYGLNAAVFTDDVDKALAVARRVRSGMVMHNGLSTGYALGFGGIKQSGIGREGSRESIQAYLESKAIAMDGTPSGFAD